MSLIGSRLGHYEIAAKLGEGGMGEVYAALDAKLHRRVALKVLPADLARDPERRERFAREAKAVAALNHPNIVTLYSIEESDGLAFLTMELMEGSSLAEAIPAGGFALARFFTLAIALADAVAAAHARGVVHRDLKPANLMLTGDGRLKVLDFGLAKMRPATELASSESPTAALTRQGTVLGSIPYMAPEQLQGKEADHRSDVFSVGLVLYEMATGRHAFRAESAAEVVSSLLRDAPPLVSEVRRDLPIQLARVLRRCLEKQPCRRFQAMLDLRNELEDLERDLESGLLATTAAREGVGAAPPESAPAGAQHDRTPAFVKAAALEELRATGCQVVSLKGHAVALWSHGDAVYAVDNRCPHMGFPLDRGSVKDCILTCHWHHARFDLATGGTLDPWADDVRRFPVEVRGQEIWVDVAEHDDLAAHHRTRVREGLEQNLPLVLAKAVIFLHDHGDDPAGPLREGLRFGTRNRREGWGQGLTILTCLANLLPHLRPADRPRALYQGLSAVAMESAGRAPRFGLRPLPGAGGDVVRLKRWLRQFVEVRDEEAAERCIVTAVRSGATPRQLADMLFAAATDHRYLEGGHVVDFVNKALEALDLDGWTSTEPVLASLTYALANGFRMEESNSWRHPVDLVSILDQAFAALPTALEIGQGRRGSWRGEEPLHDVLLGDDPQSTTDALLVTLRQGATEDEIAGAVAYAAALRIARFHTSNEIGDWDTALHTFTFANAVHQGLRRTPSPELVRGVFDAAMSLYLDRFLNVPAAAIPEGRADVADGEALLGDLAALLDRQQQVAEAASLVADFLASGHDAERLIAALGAALLRENRDFHTIQAVEAAARQFRYRRGRSGAHHLLIAAARYLAAHAPTLRSQDQTFRIAQRLHRGERLYDQA
ncbi:MAG TPA: protein kinase [Thermoanaerobaculia bacterium]|nr:protein kinase [Thermoanaerobaculia bacterium]